MAATPVKDPPAVVIKMDSWFHAGWMDAVLGLTERDFTDPDHPVADTDIDSYRDGYKMAKDTKFDITNVLIRMSKLGQYRPIVNYK